MFERKGVVKISLDGSMDEAKKEVLVEAALENGAVDFEESTSDEGATELEVCSLCCSVVLQSHSGPVLLRTPGPIPVD